MRGGQNPILTSQRGVVLIALYLVAAVLFLIEGAYVMRITEDHRGVQRHTEHLRALHYAEAGLDKALVELNKPGNENYNGTPSPVALGHGSYTVTVTPRGTTLKIIDVVGSYPNTDPSPRTEHIQALVQMVPDDSTLLGLYAEVLARVGELHIDGYDSRFGPYGQQIGSFTNQGLPTAIGTNSTQHVPFAKGIEFTNIFSGGGTTAWCGPAPAGTPDCVSGDESDLVAIKRLEAPITLPPPPTDPPRPPAIASLNVTGGIHTLNNSTLSAYGAVEVKPGHYVVSLNALVVKGTAKVYVADNIFLEVYVNGPIEASGSAVVQPLGNPHDATKLIVNTVGTPASGTSVNLSGNATFTGALIANNIDVSMSGNFTMYGALFAKNITYTTIVNGDRITLNYDRHLEEILHLISGFTKPKMMSWKRN